MKKDCCIVIITHKEKLGGDEEMSFKQALKIFNGKRDIKVVLPDDISYEYYDDYKKSYNFETIKVNNKWLKSYKAYNEMCCNKDFYKLFKAYDYMLIHQLDCWIFEDRLDEFIEKDYDYYGAPWPHLKDAVGNGGLSLRKVKKMLEVSSKYKFDGDSIENHCDTWFCIAHKDDIKVCDLETACNFSLEAPSKKYSELIKTYPMGLHGQYMKRYWGNFEKLIESFGKKKDNHKVKVLFDHQIFDLQKFGGINRQYNDLSEILNKTNEFSVDFTINHDKNTMTNKESSIEQLKRGDFDVFYPTFFSPYFLDYIGDKPFVMSVHDMAAEIYEDMFRRNDLQIVGRRILCERANAIEVPTEHTKKDLLRFLNVDEKKIYVVGRALNPSFGNEYDKENKRGYEYILYVGGRRGYKRFDWFAKHISKFLTSHKEIHLVCTGADFNDSEKKMLIELGIKDRCHATFVNDYELATLYKHAKFFVFSSEFEGFGLPILEAYKMDCITLLNDIDVFREVTFNKGIYFSMNEEESNISEIAEKIMSITTEERNAVIEAQRSVLKERSTEKYISNFCNMFRRVIAEHKKKIKVALCCIGRLENKYIREYVSYYEKIGFDKIFLYDNNMKDEERFEDVIGDYIENGFVEVIDYRGRDRAQLSAYQDCYDRHGNEYDWIGFFDIDEFFTFINREPNIKVYLSDGRFRDYDMIHVNWLCYGDNDLVRYEDKPVTKRFTHPITPFDSKRTYDFPENNHIKTLIRGGLNNVKWSKTPHTPICDGIKCCNGTGDECSPNSPFNNYEYSTVCLRHYQTKTIEEFYTNKVKRGYPDGNKSFFDTHSWVTNFFKSNKSTPEKLAYINEVSDNENKLDLFICTHKDFEPPVKNPCYKIINAKDINNDTAENGLPGSFYSEFLIYFDVAKRKDLKDYIGFCHYRKYFSFMDDIPDMDDLFKECDIVTVDRITFRKTIKEQYAACHNVDDLEIVENIIREKFPEYADAADYTFNRCNKMFQCNMFIMKKNDFLDYVNFVKSVLDEYLNVVGMDINQRILDNKEKYLKNIKDKPQNSEIWYQYRIGGYLGERLTNVFIYGNRERFGKIKTYKLTETEEKYKKKDKEMKKLALIIPTKDNSESLLRLLYSIVYRTEYDKAKLAIHVVDNGSKEDEKNKVIKHLNRVIKEYGYDIRYHETDNYTLPQLYNFVANEKIDNDTDLLLFCTDNVELTNDAITKLVDNWSEQCGTLGARLMFEDDTIQHIGYNIKKDNFTCYDVVQKQILPAEYRDKRINVYGNSNSFMLTSVALWKQINGFDEKYKSNFFDIDYSIKALLNGKNSYNITGAVCWYHKAIKSKYAKRDENRISKRIKEYLTIIDETAEKRREDKAKNA